ncbi:MAG: bifunctional phosphoribosylaminoimidazolecarboxamide formyltransferase/IMP cyclohydrolase [Thermoplasmata archaeon]|nr:bifunctional phosphoribosylaminoimidazolecarboxamide formyltransferase/IMP cyclohydrolase [Thermoplasmata archaeon]
MPSDALAAVRIRRALLSVFSTDGLVDLAAGLHRHGVELIATTGTRKHLADHGLASKSVEEIGATAAALGGRVKTLHPAVLGPILAPRTPDGLREIAQEGWAPIDVVVVNFYPFVATARRGASLAERVEAIDVGGVTLARAAAKNFAWVAVVSDPSDYPPLLQELAATGGSVSPTLRARLAEDAFARCAAYDAEIAVGLDPASPKFPELLVLRRSNLELRYGENPHQAAAGYQLLAPEAAPLLATPLKLRKGAALSYTNLIDLDTAVRIVGEFPTPTAAVVKHATPCGVASGATIADAIAQAIATDPVARYGCAIAVNRPVGLEVPPVLHGVFVDSLAAPKFEDEVFPLLEKRAKLKLVEAPPPELTVPRWELRSTLGHLLLQETDQRELLPTEFRPVTSRTATPHEACALDFAWRVARHARSNSIVLAQGSVTVGIGSGQPTRVKAVELAVEVAGDRAKGSVLASDAFFPFADGIEAAGRAGVAAILQPGGSLRDTEVIAAAERWKMAMYFTGWRIFRH